MCPVNIQVMYILGKAASSVRQASRAIINLKCVGGVERQLIFIDTCMYITCLQFVHSNVDI